MKTTSGLEDTRNEEDTSDEKGISGEEDTRNEKNDSDEEGARNNESSGNKVSNFWGFSDSDTNNVDGNKILGLNYLFHFDCHNKNDLLT